MNLKKRYLLPLLLLTGLMISPVHADDVQTDHQMGTYITPDQDSTSSSDSGTSTTSDADSTEAANPRLRSFVAAAPAVSAPSNLDSNDTSLPRKDAVDVASHQSWMTQADFNALKSAGVKTIVVKLTEGTWYTNPYAKSHMQMARNAGLNVATYHFVENPANIQN